MWDKETFEHPVISFHGIWENISPDIKRILQYCVEYKNNKQYFLIIELLNTCFDEFPILNFYEFMNLLDYFDQKGWENLIKQNLLRLINKFVKIRN